MAEVEEVKLEVYNPTASFEVNQGFAARLPDLNGKIIAEVANPGWQFDRMFALVESLLKEKYPTAKFISYKDLPELNNVNDTKGLEEALKAVGAQAAIIGNAG
jgi:hypothetical protein